MMTFSRKTRARSAYNRVPARRRRVARQDGAPERLPQALRRLRWSTCSDSWGTRQVARAVQRCTEPGEGQSKGGALPTHGGAPVAKNAAPTPAGVAAHLGTAAEQADMPSVADTPALITEEAQIQADLRARQEAAERAHLAPRRHGRLRTRHHHFDMRGLGPIRRIVKTAEGSTISLGNGWSGRSGRVRVRLMPAVRPRSGPADAGGQAAFGSG